MHDYPEKEDLTAAGAGPEPTADGYTPEIPPLDGATVSDSDAAVSESSEIPESPDTPEETPEFLAEPETTDETEPEEAPLPKLQTEDVSSEPIPSPVTADFAAEDVPENRPAERPSKSASEGWLRRNWREHRIPMVISGCCLFLALLLICGISYVFFIIHPYATYDKILPNVCCAGVNLGGMTQQEAQIAIEDALRSPDYSIKLVLPDCEYTFQPEQEGVTLNGAQVAQLAYEHGREDPSAYGIYKAYHSAQRTQYRLDAKTDLIYSSEDIENLARKISDETYVAPTESTAECDREVHRVTLKLGTPGRMISAETIAETVDRAFDDMVFDDISMEYEKVEIDMKALRQLTGTCREEYSVDAVDPAITANEETHAIDLTMGTQGWKLNGNQLYALAEEAVEQERYGAVTMDLEPVEPAEVDITPAYHELAGDPVEPYYYGGQVVEGSYGYTLDWEKAISDIMECTYGDTLSIAMTPIAPKHTAEEIRAVLFRDRLSSYSSPHTANSGRTHNLSLACQAINGTVINAGETFSFNTVVGERTAAKGYRAATVYVGTESKEELGGGVCQVASTIYDAALYAEMEITSRMEHNFFVTYVPGGLDATVYWGSVDFCFRNNTEYPIRVNASVSGGYVYISIDGTKTNDHVVKLSSTRLSSTPYSTVYENTGSLPSGTQKETVSPYTGYVYEAYQYIYDGSGNLLDTVYLGKSTYRKRDRVISVGTG